MFFSKFKKIAIFIGFVVISLSNYTLAQGFSNGGDASKNPNFNVKQIANFSKKVEKSLAEKGALVAIVSRVGRDESELPKGIHYTHVAFWVYSTITLENGKKVPGYVSYNLYQREKQTDISDIVIDYPVNFFGGVFKLKAGVVIPKPALQKKLLAIINSPTFKKLHVPNYSVVANPFNLQYQNCTEFVLDIINSALYNTDNVKQIKANEKKYFTPQLVNIGGIKALMGNLFVRDFTTKDQSNGKIETATFTTIKNFMNKYNLSQNSYEIN